MPENMFLLVPAGYKIPTSCPFAVDGPFVTKTSDPDILIGAVGLLDVPLDVYEVTDNEVAYDDINLVPKAPWSVFAWGYNAEPDLYLRVHIKRHKPGDVILVTDGEVRIPGYDLQKYGECCKSAVRALNLIDKINKSAKPEEEA